MPTETTPLAIQTLGKTLGPCYLSAMGTAMYMTITNWYIYIVHSLPYTSRLFGINNLQVYFYFRSYKQDGTFQKFLVFYIWYDDIHLLSIVRTTTEKIERFLDTIHMAFVIIDSWHDLIDSFGNYNALLIVSWCVPLCLTLVNCLNERKPYRSYRVSSLQRSGALKLKLILGIVADDNLCASNLTATTFYL